MLRYSIVSYPEVRHRDDRLVIHSAGTTTTAVTTTVVVLLVILEAS